MMGSLFDDDGNLPRSRYALHSGDGRCDFARRGCGGALDPTRADLPALEAAVNRLARRAGACVRVRAPKPRA